MLDHARKEYVDNFIVYGASVCFIILLSITHILMSYKVTASLAVPNVEVKKSDIVFDKNVFSSVSVRAKAYVVYDLISHEVIAGKNETALLPLASITKVMTAVSSSLHTSKDEKISITQKSIEDGFDLGLKNHQEWKLAELLKYTLVFSSNDGAQAVADNLGGKDAFVSQMNTDAKNLGLALSFTDPAGRDLHGKIGGSGNAIDVARLFEIARKNIPEIMDATTKKRQTMIASSGKVSGIPNTNQDVQSYPGIEGSKTGYTDLAGGNLGVVIDVALGHPVVIVVLGSTREGRFEDMNTLYTALIKSMRSNP